MKKNIKGTARRHGKSLELVEVIEKLDRYEAIVTAAVEYVEAGGTDHGLVDAVDDCPVELLP